MVGEVYTDIEKRTALSDGGQHAATWESVTVPQDVSVNAVCWDCAGEISRWGSQLGHENALRVQPRVTCGYHGWSVNYVEAEEGRDRAAYVYLAGGGGE